MNNFSSDLLLFLKKFDAEPLYDLFIEHFKLGTAELYIEEGKIIGAVRCNVSQSGRVFLILDLFIDDVGIRKSMMIMRYFGYKGWKRFPNAKYIKFDRGLKQGTTNRIYKLSTLLKTR